MTPSFRATRALPVLFVALALAPSPAAAAFTTCAVPWSNFTNVRDYTLGGDIVRDHELSADPSNGGASVPPAETDLASGSPGSYPGPRTTPGYAYWNGGTAWDPLNPSTMEDDHILFRMRLRGTPETNKGDFSSYHWNILFDVDDDGYKEYWIDINGTYQSSGNTDQVQILYDNLNTQIVDDDDAARVNEYSASANALASGSCTGGSPGLSHARTFSVVSVDSSDLSGDYILEVQIPLTAFNDLQGNQVVYPNSPIAFMFSTSASNQDPLQKDLMADINYIASTEPITFGDVISFVGNPVIRFTTAGGDDISFYSPGDPVYVNLNYAALNTNSATIECATVVVYNPYSGDTESVTVCETGPNSGVFTNWSGSCNRVTWNDADQGFDKDVAETTNLRGWITGLTPTASTAAATWTLRYVDATGTSNDGWDVYRDGVLQNTVANRLKPGTSGATYAASELSLSLFHDAPTNNDSIQFCLAPPLPSSSTDVGAGNFHMDPSDTIYALYPSLANVQTSDSALVLGSSSDPCSTRSWTYLSRGEGTLTDLFQVASTEATSDRYWVTVFDAARNTNATTIQTITVTVTSSLTGDSQTFTLDETGVNTGEFRNGAGQQLKLTDLTVTANDGTLEVGDADTMTVSYTNSCGTAQTDTARTDSAAGGVVAFTDSTGTLDGTHYVPADEVYIKITDTTWSTCTSSFVATITSCAAANYSALTGTCSAARDTQSVTVLQTSSGSGIFMNVGVGATAVTAQTFDGSATANDGVLEALDADVLIVSYTDCNDGDAISTNNNKIDTAYFWQGPKVASIEDLAVATRASLLGVVIDPAGVVEFATGSQKGTRSFRLYETAARSGAPRVALHDAPVPASRPDSSLPQRYRVETRPVAEPFVVIEETETDGRVRVVATVAVGDARLEAAFRRVSERLARTVDARGAALRAASARPHRGARAAGGSARAAAVRTSGDGDVLVPWSDLAALGAPARPNGVKVSSRGRNVPFGVVSTPQGPALSFRARGLRSDYATENAVVVSWAGGGSPAPFAGLTGERPATPAGFVRIERSVIYASSAPLGADAFQWDLLTPVEDLGLWGGEGDPTWPYSWWWPGDGVFDLPALTSTSGSAAVRVRVLGASDHAHTVDAWLNGSMIGTTAFAGHGERVIEGSVPASALRTSGNQLELRYSSGTTGGYLYFDSIEIGAAFATTPQAVVTRVEAFDASLPSTSGVRYLILTHGDFGAAAAQIAGAKQSEGLATAVVDVDRAYDRYTDGVADPLALRAAIREFARNGSLRYVLLVGDDSLDPNDALGFGGGFFAPSFQAWTPTAGRFPTENAFADVDGDGSPDVAIGRLPVSTPDEALAVAAKIGRQAAAVAANRSSHVLAVDDGFFSKGSKIRAWVDSSVNLTLADVGAGVGPARTNLFGAFENGVAVAHYFGHGGPSIWADESLLTTDDVPSLAGTPEAVVFMWACQAQWYQYFWGPSLGEALLTLPDGGALATFGPTGITSDDQQARLASGVYPRVFGEGLSIGEAVRRAKAAAAAAGDRDVVEGFILLGDPALVVRPRP